MEKRSPSPELLQHLQEISEHANDIAFLAQGLLVDSPSPLSVGGNDLTTLLTLLVLSLFLGSYTIVGRTSRAANLSIVNLTAPVCTAITAGVWLIVSKGESTLGLAHTMLTAFLLSFGVVAGFAAVYRRFQGSDSGSGSGSGSAPDKRTSSSKTGKAKGEIQPAKKS